MLMAYKIKQSGDYRKRRNFSMIKNSLELDNLLQIQKESYQWFVTEGVKEVLEDFSPVESFSGSLSLEFNDYVFDTPRYSIKECKDIEKVGDTKYVKEIGVKVHCRDGITKYDGSEDM